VIHTYTLLLVTLSVFPALFIAHKIIEWDNLKPEPYKDLWRVFYFGMLVVFPVALVELAVSSIFDAFRFSPLVSVFIESFIVAGLIEEWAKMRVIMKKIYTSEAFDEHMDGIVYSIMASMGFALVENFFYVMGGGISTGILRSITAVPMHAMTTGIMGYYIGLSIFMQGPKKNAVIYKGLFIAVFTHGLYDFFCLNPGKFLWIIPFLYFIYKYLRFLMSIAKKHDIERMKTSPAAADEKCEIS